MAFSLVTRTVVGSGGASSIQFDNIPQTGKDLVIWVSSRTNVSNATTFFNLSFNGSTSSFATIGVAGNGNSVITRFTTPTNFGSEAAGNTATANIFGNSQIYLANYSTVSNKGFIGDGVGENNASTSNSTLSRGLWSGNSAITSITLTPTSGNFLQHTSASLYIIS